MLVLLPPSEGKTAPAGPPLDLDLLSLPELTQARSTALSALTRLCRADPDRARTALGLSPRMADEVERDAHLQTAPTGPAGEVYSGVLYEALGLATMRPRARRRVEQWALVSSGLWGAVRLTDPIPAYRLPASAVLPGTGRMSTYWRAPLADALDRLAAGHVVLDLRSGSYAASWTPPAASSVVVRVVHEQAGQRTVASHFNKATKGRLLRALAEGRAEPSSVRALVRAIQSAGFRAELAAPRAAGSDAARPATLDVVVDAL